MWEKYWANSLDAQVDVLLDAEAEVAVVAEVLLPQLVLLHLEPALQDLLGLGEQGQEDQEDQEDRDNQKDDQKFRPEIQTN